MDNPQPGGADPWKAAVARIGAANGFKPEQVKALLDLSAAVVASVTARIPLRMLDQFVTLFACQKCDGRGVLGKKGGLGECLACGGLGWILPEVAKPVAAPVAPVEPAAPENPKEAASATAPDEDAVACFGCGAAISNLFAAVKSLGHWFCGPLCASGGDIRR